MVDVALDRIEGEDESPATALADLLDRYGQWDWTDDSAHDPSDRFAVVESTGAWWLVYRGTEADAAWRHATRESAEANMADRTQA
jgi:hypothetical protein